MRQTADKPMSTSHPVSSTTIRTFDMFKRKYTQPVELRPCRKSVQNTRFGIVFYPFDVTVKFRLIPAQEPTGPQSVGGLSERVSERSSLNARRDGRVLDYFWTRGP